MLEFIKSYKRLLYCIEFTTERGGTLLSIRSCAGWWPKCFLWNWKPCSSFSIPAMRQFQDKFAIFKKLQTSARRWKYVVINACFRWMMRWLWVWIFTICLGKGWVQRRRITWAHFCCAPHVTCVSMTFCWLLTHADTLSISIFLRLTFHASAS